MRNLDLDVEKIAGPIAYSSELGLSSSGLTAALWGDPINVAIGDFSDASISASAERARVDITGKLDAGHIASWLQQPVLTFLDGGAEAAVRVEHYDGKTTVNATSDLQGITVELPGELYKAAGVELPLSLLWQMDEKNQPMSIAISRRATMNFFFQDTRLTAGSVYVGADAGRDSSQLEAENYTVFGKCSRIF